jgi:hypothetical protein
MAATYRSIVENSRERLLAFGKTGEITGTMLQRNERGTPRPIAIEFPDGPHTGERYNADLSFCPNPICICGYAALRLFRDPPGEMEESAPEFRFDLDLIERALATAEKEGRRYDRNIGQALVEQMREEDWQLLWQHYFAFKETPDEELETHFPVAEIEASRAMVAFQEVLPFTDDLLVEADGSHFLFDDQYCVRSDCNCTTAYLTLVEKVTEECIEKPDMAVLSIDYRSGQWQVEDLAGKDADLLERLAKQLISKENRVRIEERHKRLRSLYRIDKRSHHSPARSTTRKLGRNAPCPCGSGKKYKKCCIAGSG